MFVRTNFYYQISWLGKPDGFVPSNFTNFSRVNFFYLIEREQFVLNFIDLESSVIIETINEFDNYFINDDFVAP